MAASRSRSKKRSKQTDSGSKPSSRSTTTPAAPVSTSPSEPEIDSQRLLELLGRFDGLAQGDAAAKALERQTIELYFDHLAGRPVDPRITQWFRRPSPGWRVPWSRSEQVPEGTTHVVRELNPGQELGRVTTPRGEHVEFTQVPEQVLSPVREGRPVGYVRLGRARRLS